MARHYALRVVVTALLRIHPSPEAVRSEIQSVAEQVRAQILPSGWSDTDLEDFERDISVLCESLLR